MARSGYKIDYLGQSGAMSAASNQTCALPDEPATSRSDLHDSDFSRAKVRYAREIQPFADRHRLSSTLVCDKAVSPGTR
jgi:hypothetical protein